MCYGSMSCSFCLFPSGDRQHDRHLLFVCVSSLAIYLEKYMIGILFSWSFCLPPFLQPAKRSPLVCVLVLLPGLPSGEINSGHCSLRYFLAFSVVPSWRPANLSPLVLALVLLRGHPSGEEPILGVFFSALLLLVSPLVRWFSSLATCLEI